MRQVYKIAFLLFYLPWHSFGAQKSIPAKEIQAISIKIPQVNLKVKHVPSSLYIMKWDGKLSFQTKKGVLLIQSPDFNSRRAWHEPSSSSVVDIEISGPSKALQLFSFSSQSLFSDWAKALFISSFKGNIKAIRTKGFLDINLKKGTFSLTRHKGPARVKAFYAEGLLSSSDGDFEFQLNEGRLKVKQSKGILSWITNRAEVRITQFEGDVKGFSQSGAVTARLQPGTAELTTGDSPLRVSFIRRSPKITAQVENGRIYGARGLGRSFSGKSTQISGWLKGAFKKGSVLLKSETGSIYIN